MKKKIIIPLLLALTIISACHEEFLEDKAYSIITQDNYFRNASDAITAVNGVYAALTNDNLYEGNMLRLNEYTSECVTTRLSVSEAYSRWDTWKFEIGDFSGIYSGSYRLIERANQVIANVPKCDMLPALKKRVIGEASFLRALSYFNLVRVYGGVPLKVSPTADFSKTSFPRAQASEVYSQIINDLRWALDSAALPKASAYATADKGRVSRSAVQTLLGKVYLTRASDATVAQAGDYQKAVDYLKAVVTEGDRSLLASYASIFANENNAEVIFDVQYIRKAGLGGNLTSFLPTSTTQELFQISYYDYPASIDFYKSFQPGDIRRSVTFYDRMKVKIGSVNNVEVYFDPAGDPLVGTWRRTDDNTLVNRAAIGAPVPGFRKFVDTDITARGNAEEPNFIVLRYSDVLLMLAEALNEINNGPTAEAYEYLNMVKRRAFAKPVATPDVTVDYSGLDKQAFREAVYTERRKEFVIECHAWFDGKRFWDIFTRKVAEESIGANPDISNRPKTVVDVNEIKKDKYKLMPFSESQLDLNKELVQNPEW